MITDEQHIDTTKKREDRTVNTHAHIIAHSFTHIVTFFFLRALKELPKGKSKAMLCNENIHHSKLLKQLRGHTLGSTPEH